MAAVWASDLPPMERLVMLALADWANADRQCWPSMPTIASRTGMDARSVRRIMARLVEGGHLEKAVKPGRGITYTLHPGPTVPPDPQSPRTLSPETPDPRSSNTKGTVSKRKGTSSLPSTRAIDMPAGTSPEAWSRFVEMRLALARKSKGKPWTDGAARIAVAKLAKLVAAGGDPDAILDQSTLNGWAGLFPLKGEARGLLGAVIHASRFDKPSGPLESRRRFHAENQVDDSDDDAVPF